MFSDALASLEDPAESLIHLQGDSFDLAHLQGCFLDMKTDQLSADRTKSKISFIIFCLDFASSHSVLTLEKSLHSFGLGSTLLGDNKNLGDGEIQSFSLSWFWIGSHSLYELVTVHHVYKS